MTTNGPESWQPASNPLGIHTPLGTGDEMDPEERRHLRDNAVHNAVLMHDEMNMDEYMRVENIEKVLNTAQALYDWVINES